MEAYGKPLDYLSSVEKFEIPFFQRSYVWEESNWEQLLEQWEYGPKKPHFLGSIICNNPYSSGEQNDGNVEVIDGQQRLTTLTILYKVLFDIMWKNSTDDIEKGGYKNQKDRILGEDGIKILHSDLDKRPYEDVMNGEVDITTINLLSDTIKENKGKKSKDRIKPSHKIYQCYKYFINCLDNSDNFERSKELWKDLNSTTKKLFVLIDINPSEDAQQIFDCTNSAGIRLSTADLIKNAIYKKIDAFEEIDKEKLRKLYNETWKKAFEETEEIKSYWDNLVSVGRIKKNNLEIFLYCVALIIGWYNPDEDRIEDLYSIYKKQIEAYNKYSDLENLLKKFVLYANEYKNAFNNEFDANGDVVLFSEKVLVADLIMKKLGTTTFYPYILKLIIDKDKDKDEKIIMLCKLLLRAAICNDETTIKNYNKECYNLVSNKKNIADYYNERLKTEGIIDGNIEEGLRNLEGRNSLANLLLFLLEIKKHNDDSAYDDNNKGLVYCYSLEHIMPQKYSTHWSFNNVPPKEYKNGKWIDAINLSDEEKDFNRREAIYKIGNMILLSPGANSKNKNKLLGVETDKKSKIYNIKTYGSNLYITSQFIREYDEKKIWDEETIENRTVDITKQLIEQIL